MTLNILQVKADECTLHRDQHLNESNEICRQTRTRTKLLVLFQTDFSTFHQGESNIRR